MPSHLACASPLPGTGDRLSSLQRRAHELAIHRHELWLALTSVGSFRIKKNNLDVIDVVWWVEELNLLADELHRGGWMVALYPGEDSASLRVWSPDDDHDSGSEDEDEDPAHAP